MAGVAQYVWPEEGSLLGPPDRVVLGTLSYQCVTCQKNTGNAQSLGGHVTGVGHKKKLETEGRVEHPEVLVDIARYTDLEAPHREANAQWKSEKRQEYADKRSAEIEAMTPEEKAIYDEGVRKRKAEVFFETQKQEALGNKKPKIHRDNDPHNFECKYCKVFMNSETQMKFHLQSPKHLATAEAVEQGHPVEEAVPKEPRVKKAPEDKDDRGLNGCSLCGLEGPINPNHFESNVHKKREGGDFVTIPEKTQRGGAQIRQKKLNAAKGGGKGNGKGKGGYGKGDMTGIVAVIPGKGGGKGYGKDMGKGNGYAKAEKAMKGSMGGKGGKGGGGKPSVQGCMVCSVDTLLPAEHFDSWQHWENMQWFNQQLASNTHGMW